MAVALRLLTSFRVRESPFVSLNAEFSQKLGGAPATKIMSVLLVYRAVSALEAVLDLVACSKLKLQRRLNRTRAADLVERVISSKGST